MKTILLLLSFSSIFPHFSLAQLGYRMVMGGRNAGMAACGLALPNDVHAVFYNPASLPTLTNTMAVVAADVRFGVSNLKPIGLGFVLPTQSGVFGVSVQHLGFDVVQQQKLGVGFGRRLMENMSLGVQLDYVRWAVEGYATAHLLTVELACNVQIFKELTLATHVYNPLQVRLLGGERTPAVFQVAAAWQALSNVILTAEVDQSTHQKGGVRLGFEYRPIEAVAARLGTSFNPVALSAGVGYRLNPHFSIDVALYQHFVLGATPAASVVYDFGNNKKGSKTPPQ